MRASVHVSFSVIARVSIHGASKNMLALASVCCRSQHCAAAELVTTHGNPMCRFSWRHHRARVGTDGSTALKNKRQQGRPHADSRFFFSGGGCGRAIARNTPLRTACCSEPLISATNPWHTAMLFSFKHELTLELASLIAQMKRETLQGPTASLRCRFCSCRDFSNASRAHRRTTLYHIHKSLSCATFIRQSVGRPLGDHVNNINTRFDLCSLETEPNS